MTAGNLETEQERHRLIDSLYREILGRPVDPSGLANFDRSLRNQGSVIAVPHLVKALLASRQYSERLSSSLLDIIDPKPGRQVNGRKIGHVISLGTHCLVSAFMKKYKYKRYSLPFDWLFASPAAVLHCLNDDFKEFLDGRHHVSLKEFRKPPQHPGAEHKFYLDQYGVKSMFAHRDPTDEKDLRYYHRTVSRFRQILATPDAKLFVMFVRPLHDAAGTFPALSAKINAMTANSAFVCVQLLPPTNIAGCHATRQLQVNGEHFLYEFQPSSTERGIYFQEPLDDLILMRLVRQYDVNLAPEVKADA